MLMSRHMQKCTRLTEGKAMEVMGAEHAILRMQVAMQSVVRGELVNMKSCTVYGIGVGISSNLSKIPDITVKVCKVILARAHTRQHVTFIYKISNYRVQRYSSVQYVDFTNWIFGKTGNLFRRDAKIFTCLRDG